MKLNNYQTMAAELCVELSATISHLSSKRNYLAPDNRAVVPQALLTVLATCIALNFNRGGHPRLIELTTERLTTLIKDADEASQSLTDEQRFQINPMAPCACGNPASGAAKPVNLETASDDDVGAALAAAVAKALGVDPKQVKAIKMDPHTSAVDPRDAAALAVSDAPDNLAKVAADVEKMIDSIFGPKTKH